MAVLMFAAGSGPIHMDDVACTGRELTLAQCPHAHTSDCNHTEDAGVHCLVTRKCAHIIISCYREHGCKLTYKLHIATTVLLYVTDCAVYK